MLRAVVVSNAILGLNRMFRDSSLIRYRFVEVTADFRLDLEDADVLIVPNGSDHVAMLKVRDTVSDFLEAGGALLCFDGWFTNWIPGNQWIFSNEKRTRDIRYFVGEDHYGLFAGVAMDDLQFNHGISGWWACGYIQAAPEADVVMHDTWERPMIVLDETSTNGLMVMTASGPLADAGVDVSEAPDATPDGLTTLYRNIINFVHARKNTPAHVEH